MSFVNKIQQLLDKREEAKAGGGQKHIDPQNHLLMHAMAPNVAGVIGSAVAAGILISFLL